MTNRLKEFCEAANLKQSQLAERLEGANSTAAVSMIANGKVLPTKPDLMEICKALNVEPTDIYAPADLDLLGTRSKVHGVGKRQHSENLTEFRVWCSIEYKAAIEKAISELGYKSMTDWFRAVAATLLKQASERSEI